MPLVEILLWIGGAILIGVSAIWVLAGIAVFLAAIHLPHDMNDEI